MKQRYVTQFGNWNGWWDDQQLVERVTVRSKSEAIEYVAERNEGILRLHPAGGRKICADVSSHR